MVRDADKLDIWQLFIEYYGLPEVERASAVGLGLPDLPGCSSEVLASLERGDMLQLSTLRTLTDFKLLQLSWVFDLNFYESFRMFEEQDFIARFAATLPADPIIGRALQKVREYVAEQLARPQSISSVRVCNCK